MTDCTFGTLAKNSLPTFLKNENSVWFHIPSYIFKELGGIKFLLKCDYDIRKLPIKLSAFYQQVLLYWKMIYKHNYSPHNTPLWNCRYVVFRNKSLCFNNWLDKGIWSVMHLLDNTGNIMTYENFCVKFNVNNRKQYDIIVKAIPQAMVTTSRNLYLSNANPQLPELLVNGFPLTNLNVPNHTIRKIFVNELYPYLTNRNSVLKHFSKEDSEKLRTKYLKFPIAPKVKEVHFKILNGIYPSGEFLNHRFGLDIRNCPFCDEHVESTEHLFYDCKYATAFWEDFHYWLYPKVEHLPELAKEDVIFGIVMNNNAHDLAINTLICLGKFFLHKNKYLNAQPKFIIFHKELCLYFSSLKVMRTKNAVKVCNLVEELKLADHP